MIVLIEEIGENGLEVTRELSKAWLDEVLSGDGGPETGFSAASDATLKARLDKVSGGVVLSGKTQLKLKGGCKRCLTETKFTVPVDYTLNLVNEKKLHDKKDEDEGESKDQEGPGASFDPQAAEDEKFNGREIDLGKITREQILLALPMDVLCKDACKGLCTVCGKDLNEGECGCNRTVTDPRWAALKDIKLT